MKALTVRQPWAWAIVRGTKRIENRSRQIHYRGPLVIHAGRSRAEFKADFSSLMPGLPPADALDYGHLIGVVEVVGCLPFEEIPSDPFAEGPWCWILANPRPIRPVPWTGSLGIFEVPEASVEYLTPASAR